jgi:DNA-binding NtrC family response regulator
MDEGAPLRSTLLPGRPTPAPDGAGSWSIRVLASPEETLVDRVFVLPPGGGRIGREPCGVDLVLRDPHVSRIHATLRPLTAPGRPSDVVVVVDCTSSSGLFVNGRRVEREPLRPGDVLRLGESVLLLERAAPGRGDEEEAYGIFGRSPAVCELRDTIRRVAPSQLPVVLVGATGTGKELVARALHAASGRRGRFVAVNCAALPGQLVENALFGHRRGAYTDATSDQDGAFMLAHGGTLFLDEIGDLAPEAQPKLLRALEMAEVTPLGATIPVAVDLRVVAATHVALEEAVRQSRFREDLYARLAGVRLRTPALADRRQDILPLMRRFLPAPARERPMSADFVEALLLYEWPRNVRELMMLAERLHVLHPDARRFELAMLDEELGVAVRARQAPAGPAPPQKRPPTRAELRAELERCRGNVSRVARIMGRNRKQIYRWMDTYGLGRGEGRAAIRLEEPAPRAAAPVLGPDPDER